MFQSLFKHAEATVDHAVTGLVFKMLVAIPFLIALGFLTAAATIYLNRRFDVEVGYLIMTGAFLIVGVFAAAVLNNHDGAASSPTEHSRETPPASKAASRTEDSALNSADHEMLMAALAAIGPAAAPALVRLLLRNLPLVATIAAAGFVLTRPATEQAPLEPAE